MISMFLDVIFVVVITCQKSENQNFGQLVMQCSFPIIFYVFMRNNPGSWIDCCQGLWHCNIVIFDSRFLPVTTIQPCILCANVSIRRFGWYWVFPVLNVGVYFE